MGLAEERRLRSDCSGKLWFVGLAATRQAVIAATMNSVKGFTIESRIAYVLSDVHLISMASDESSYTSDSRVDADDLCAILRRLLAEDALIVINGDLFDLDRARLPTQHSSYMQEMKSSLPEHPLWRILADDRVLLISGNHDVLASDDLGAHQQVDIMWGETRVRAEHGDRFDAVIKKARSFTRWVTWLNGKAQQASLRPVTWAMRKVERMLARDTGGELVERALLWLERHPEYHALVIGHTHQIECVGTEGCMVINSGQSMHWPLDLVRVNLAQQTVDMLSISAEDVRGAAPLQPSNVVMNPSLAQIESAQHPSTARFVHVEGEPE